MNERNDRGLWKGYENTKAKIDDCKNVLKGAYDKVIIKAIFNQLTDEEKVKCADVMIGQTVGIGGDLTYRDEVRKIIIRRVQEHGSLDGIELDGNERDTVENYIRTGILQLP